MQAGLVADLPIVDQYIPRLGPTHLLLFSSVKDMKTMHRHIFYLLLLGGLRIVNSQISNLKLNLKCLEA